MRWREGSARFQGRLSLVILNKFGTDPEAATRDTRLKVVEFYIGEITYTGTDVYMEDLVQEEFLEAG